jgi:ankyrin repeat protein
MATRRDCILLIYKKNFEKLRVEIDHCPDLVFSVDNDDRGWTLLMHAASNRSFECARILVEKGASVNQKSNWGYTALMAAVTYNNYEITQYLLLKGAEVAWRDKISNLSAFERIIIRNDKREMFGLFAPYKNQFDEKDLDLYHEHRLSALFR